MGDLILAYLLVVNVLAFGAMGSDKRRAKHPGVWRIPEKTLMGLAAIGGSVGAILGMRVFHHKTLHNKFRYGLPAILAAQLVLAAWVLGM